jgi:hypothetical protein
MRQDLFSLIGRCQPSLIGANGSILLGLLRMSCWFAAPYTLV